MSQPDHARRFRERLPDLGFEAVVIVIGVLLALALNSWRESMAERRLVGRVEDTIRSEIRQNRESVAAAFAYHEPLVDELRAGRRGERILALDLGARGIDLARISNPSDFFRGALAEGGFPAPADLFALPEDEGSFRLVSGIGQLFAKVRGDTLEVFVERPLELRSAFVRNSAWETAQAMRAPVLMDYELVALMSDLFQRQEEYNDLAASILQRLYDGGPISVPPIEDLTNLEESLLESYDRTLEILDD